MLFVLRLAVRHIRKYPVTLPKSRVPMPRMAVAAPDEARLVFGQRADS
jgi:hypothetical protein